MKFRGVLGDRTGVVLLQLGAAGSFCVFNSAWGTVKGSSPASHYLVRDFCCLDRVFFLQGEEIFTVAMDTVREMEKPWLVTEILKVPDTFEGKKYWEAMRISMKALEEQVSEAEQKQRAYREYVENWVHQVKLPLTAAQLVCENEKSRENRRILKSLENIDREIEQVLYMSRMENPGAGLHHTKDNNGILRGPGSCCRPGDVQAERRKN